MCRGSNSSKGDFFSTLSEQSCGPTQPYVKAVLASFSQGQRGGGVVLTTHPIWRRCYRNCKVTPLLYLWTFMECCKVKFSLPLPLLFTSPTSDFLILHSVHIFLSQHVYVNRHFLPRLDTRQYFVDRAS
jgi:hypothetical protein